jgi:hypothetical protein
MHQNRNDHYYIFATLILLLLISLACGFGPTEQLPETVEVEALQEPEIEDQPVEEMSTNSAIFKTPEEAINYYFDGLAQADIRKIMEACAIDEMAEKSSFDLFIEQAGSMTISTPAPTDYPLYIELHKAHLSGTILNRVKYFAFSLLSKEIEDGYDGNTIPMDTERTNQFVIDVNPARLAEIEVQQIDLLNKAQMNDDKHIHLADRASFYGADEATERVVLFTFEGDYYYLGFMLLRYGENWKISSQVSTMANTNKFGAAQKTTIEEFEALVNGD